jgi:quercetin dioxygenase-like cupin family protein
MRNCLIPLAASVAAAILASPALAADTPGQVYMNANEVKWGDVPPNLPKGAKIAVLSGDPGKAGPFVGRLMMPAGYKIAPHYHSTDEELTIISGTFYLAEGDKLDEKNAHAMKAGGFHHLPAKTHHFAFAKGPTVVQINAMGPFDIVYLNPDDDPSKKAAATPAPAAAKKK